MRHSFSSVQFAGVPVHGASLGDAIDWLVGAASRGGGATVHLCNAYVLSLAARDLSYRDVLAAGDLNLADGAPVAWTMRRLGLPLHGGRPSGSELFEGLLARSSDPRLRHYLYGSTPTVVRRLADTIQQRWPAAELAGVESPPFRPLQEDEYLDLVQRLRDSGASIVWIGTGTPRQDILVQRLRADVDAILIPVGAAFDFMSGAKPRAPAAMRKLGLEWLYRLLQEPGRLWRRYLIGNALFVRVALRARVVPSDRSPWP